MSVLQSTHINRSIFQRDLGGMVVGQKSSIAYFTFINGLELQT